MTDNQRLKSHFLEAGLNAQPQIILCNNWNCATPGKRRLVAQCRLWVDKEASDHGICNTLSRSEIPD